MTLPHTSPLNASEYLLNDFNYFWQHSRSQTSGTRTVPFFQLPVTHHVKFNIYSLHSPKKNIFPSQTHIQHPTPWCGVWWCYWCESRTSLAVGGQGAEIFQAPRNSKKFHAHIVDTAQTREGTFWKAMDSFQGWGGQGVSHASCVSRDLISRLGISTRICGSGQNHGTFKCRVKPD